MDLLINHRSVRQFKPEQVPDKLIAEILESGIRASNTGNMQLYSIIVNRDEKKKKELAPFHFNQKMVIEAPLLVTICLDFNRFLKWCKLNATTTDFTNLLWLINGTVDCSILAQNICIAAEFRDLGICYLGTTLYNAPEISSALELPKGVIPITALVIGYPEIIPELTLRLPIEAVVHSEKYCDYSDQQISAYYSDIEQLDSSKKFVLENGKENLAQVFTEVRYKTRDSLFFSEKLNNMLLDQGFEF